MFIGHYAVALAAKKAAPKTSLGMLFFSAQFLDLLWPVLLLSGLEHVRIDPGNTAFSPFDFYDYPISHSLVTAIGWSVGVALIYYSVCGRYQRGAWVVAACVCSHWILDFLTHRPDLPIAPGSTLYAGLGLWNSILATILVEAALFVAGLVIYLRSTEPIDRIGTYGFWLFITFTIIAYISASLTQQPPGVQAIALGGLSQWLIVPWTYWIDRHRRVRDGAVGSGGRT